MLRWPHDHHRDLRTRLHAALSANATNHNQNRYVLTTIATPKTHNTHLSRWSIRLAGARSIARFRSQLVQFMHRPSSPKPDIHAHSPSLIGDNAFDQCSQLRWLPSRTSPTALKSP